MGSEDHLDKIPMKPKGVSWSTDEAGIVTLDIEDTDAFNRIAQKLFRKPEMSHIHLDQMGSYVWPLMDGERGLLDLDELVEAQFGNKASPPCEWLAKYVQILGSYHFVRWEQ